MYSQTFTKANTQVIDTIRLGYGCYTFNFTDAGGDGLSWWASSQGNGTLTLRNYGNSTSNIKSFPTDFGNFLTLHFRTGAPVGIDEKNT